MTKMLSQDIKFPVMGMLTFGLALYLRVRVSMCSIKDQNATPQPSAKDQSAVYAHCVKYFTHSMYISEV